MRSSSQASRALIAGYHAYPDPAVGARRISELANFLSDHGWQVKVLAADDRGATGAPQLHPAIERIGVQVPQPLYVRFKDFIPNRWRGDGRSSSAPASLDLLVDPCNERAPKRSRLIDSLRTEYFRYTAIVDQRKRWAVRFARAMVALSSRWRPSVVLVSGPEWSPVAAATSACALQRLPLVVDFRDPWLGRGGLTFPEYEGARRTVDAWLESRSVRNATLITVTSARLLAELKARYPERSGSMHLVRNGYDASAWLDPATPNGRLDLLYAGTVYFNRSPMPLLEGLRRFVRRPDIDRQKVSVTMVGDCASWRGLDLAAWALAHGVADVLRIEPPVPAHRVRDLIVTSSVLVTLAQAQPSQVPAKLFEQIGANREIVLYTERDSESADVVAGLPWVSVVDDDPRSTEEYLAAAYERHVRMNRPLPIDPACSAAFARTRGLETFAAHMAEIASAVT